MESQDPTPQPAQAGPSGAEEAALQRPQALPPRIEILNKTPRRIAIRATESYTQGEPEYLIISPFSSKVISKDACDRYEAPRWEQEGLIEINTLVTSTDEALSAVGLGLGCGVLLVLYLIVALLVPIFRTSIYTWIIFGVFLLAALVLGGSSLGGFGSFKETFRRVGRAILQVVNLALLVLVVFGLSVGLLYLLSGGRDWLSAREFTIEGLGRVIQYLFLTIATLLPALMYFLFNRNQRERVQEDFIRAVLRLDPGIRTITEAESKYLSMVQEAFGTTHTSAFVFSSGLPILLCTLLIFMGWLLVLQPFASSSSIDAQQFENLLQPRAGAVTFAFLGAYFFAIGLVFRRYVRADLTPKTYTHIILRLFLAIILAWTLSALPAFAGGGAAEGDGLATGLLYVLAFLVGIFPETGVTVLLDLARNPLFTRWFPRLQEDHPLTRLDGINLYDRSRFLEEGIENIENLAHHNLISLMLSTRISTNRLVDMFDQAILYLHLGQDPEEIDAARKQLRAYGIRTATDLEAAHRAAGERPGDDLAKFLMILDDEQADPPPLSRIRTILDTLRDDDWIAYLRNWRELDEESTQIYTLEGVTLMPLQDDLQKVMKMTR